MGIDSLFYLMVDRDERPDIMASLMVKTKGALSDRWLIDQGRHGIEIWTGDRLFSPHYARGRWPQIRDTITLLQSAYPGVEIRYGSDVDDGPDDAHLVTAEWLAKMDAHWEAVKNNTGPYRDVPPVDNATNPGDADAAL